MRKSFIICFVISMCLLILVGCSKQEEKKDIIIETNYQQYDEFEAAFKKSLSALPEYTLFQLSDVELDDGITCHVFTIKDELIDDTYHLRIDVNEESGIEWVYLANGRKAYGNLQFAVFSLYAYQAMNMPEIDADAFYEQYDMFSKEDICKYDSYDGYEVSCLTIGEQITFSIRAEGY